METDRFLHMFFGGFSPIQVRVEDSVRIPVSRGSCLGIEKIGCIVILFS